MRFCVQAAEPEEEEVDADLLEGVGWDLAVDCSSWSWLVAGRTAVVGSMMYRQS